jgi:hypothetical protein
MGTNTSGAALIADGTNFNPVVISGDATIATNGALTIANDAVSLAKMASGTDGNIISYDASGDPVAIATGTDGQVLTSAGAGAPPAFEDAAGGDNTPSFLARVNSQTVSDNVDTKLSFTVEDFDTDSCFDSSTNYRFTVPVGEAGKYVFHIAVFFATVGNKIIDAFVTIKKNGSNFCQRGGRPGTLFDMYQMTEGGTVILDLSEGDYIEIFARADCDGVTWETGASAGGHTMWSGFKLIE